jgi:3-deoxy-D-manno-octulosonic-acid transferase
VTVSLPYRLAVNAAVPLVPLLARDAMSRRAHAGRLAAPAELERWAREHRDPHRPLAWIHAASVGEGLQGREVLAALRELRPDLQTVATRFSASAERLTAEMPADLIAYVPYDRRRDVDRAVEALRPDLLVFAKLDLWPQLTTRAAGRGVRVGLVAGSVDPGSARLAWPGRQAARPGYRALDAVAANSEADAERLVLLGALPGRITVVGDPRIDSVLRVIDALRGGGGAAGNLRGVLVAGSTWPADEAILLRALVEVRARHPDTRVVLVPHEPTPERCETLTTMAREMGLTVLRWSGAGGAGEAAVTVVDRLGALAGLYGMGELAYVGGGFGTRGVHSVVEPAGWGRAVVIGPNDRGVRDAALLAAAGGLLRLPRSGSVAALASHWTAWREAPDQCREAGAAARRSLEGDRGAARRSAELLVGLLTTPR